VQHFHGGGEITRCRQPRPEQLIDGGDFGGDLFGGGLALDDLPLGVELPFGVIHLSL
jgi:hypothetical protein